MKNISALKKTTLLLMGIVIVSLIAFWIASPVIINYLTAGKYTAALKYSNIVAVTSCLMIVFSIFDAIINALHETKKSLLINTISAALCIILYSVAVKYYQEVGVAVSTCITYVCLIGLQAFFVIRKFKKDSLTQTVPNE